MTDVIDKTPKVKGYVEIVVIRKDGTIENLGGTDNLFTNGGRDFGHNQVYINTSAGTRGAGFIGLTTDTAAANAADTSLASEITTNGLARADASTKTHTSGTNVSTIQNTFTASGAFTAVHKAALFNAAGPPVNGTMVHEAVLPSDVTLASGDSVQITWTVTYG
jgi:hypothetical protein